ncbi:MAG: hypothetical protein ACT4N4_04630 [Rhodospirillales bacterium]
MSVSRHDLERAVQAGIIADAQVEPLHRFLAATAAASQVSAHSPHTDDAKAVRFSMVQVLWYGGALIVMSAMSMFTTLAFDRMGGAALTATALVYAAAFVVAGNILWRRGLTVPGGLLVAVAVGMAPLAVFGAQEAMGWWTGAEPPKRFHDFHVWIKSSFLPMEVATVAAGAVALRFYPFPFILMPIAFVLWYMSMDLTPFFFGEKWDQWAQRSIVSLWFGLTTLAVAWAVDLGARRNFAFWLHLAGLLAFWGGLSAQHSDSELAKAAYALINVALILLSVFLGRRAYAVFGALGVSYYFGHLAYTVFKDSLLFPFALSLLGIAVTGLGLAYYRREARIETWIGRAVPAPLLALRPPHARGL